MEFNQQLVENNIQKCRNSINTFEQELTQQRTTIREYQEMIDSGTSSFPKDALERGIDSAKQKIQVVEDAIQRERDLIKMLYEQIDHNQKQVLLEKEKLAHIEVIRE